MTEYSEDEKYVELLREYSRLEISMMPGRYLKKEGNNLTSPMRKKIVEWMIQFSFKYFTKYNTIYLAVSLLDCVFAKRGARKENAQLLACGALWVASDVETDIGKFSVQSFSKVGYSKEDLDFAKETVLQTPDLKLDYPTCYDFAYRFIQIALDKYNWDDYKKAGSLFFEEFTESFTIQVYHFLLISLLCYSCLDCPPSKIAASTVMIVLKIYASWQEWDPLMTEYTGYTIKNLDKCSRYILNEYDKDTFIEQILSKKKAAIAEKYKEERVIERKEEKEKEKERERERNRPKTYTDCHNSEDYISLDTFTSEDNIIFVYNINSDKIICYDKELLLRWFRSTEPMALWVEGDAMGYGGYPDLNHLVYSLPDGYLWVTECVVKQIRDGKGELIRIHRIMQNVPIGNTKGIMGVNMLHGQNPKDIYGCA